MAKRSRMRKIAFVGDYVPRQCGIATFTHDLREAIVSQYQPLEGPVVPVDDVPGGYVYPPEVRFQIEEQDLDSYRRAADFLNFSNTDVVCIQHEFGIFGGREGSHILALVRDLRMPVVTTLHTILREPNSDQRRVLEQLCGLSERVVVMSEKGKAFLKEIYGVQEEKIDLIPHGIPDMPFVDPNFYKDQFGVEGKYVALTFGLLSPNKGIEYALQAIPKIIERFPNFVYIVLGATHPNLLREQGEAYRLSLERLTRELGIEKHVIFYNRFVDLEELTEFIGAADIYITPYLNVAQITSGTLAYSFGCGKAVVSTPYWHAQELLADGCGILVPFRDSDAIAEAVCELLQDEVKRHSMRKRAYMLGREMIWSNVAHLYMESFQRARAERSHLPFKPLVMRTQDEQPIALPRIRLDHLHTLTDSTGIIQHAKYNVPNLQEGYCTDDNARALLLAVLLEELGIQTGGERQLTALYASFLNNAFDRKEKAVRNFLSYDRRWLEEKGSEDCLGRFIWALGACVGRSRRRLLQAWAAELFEQCLPLSLETSAPRAWAFTLLGIHEYLRRLSGDRLANQVREELAQRLVSLYEKNASDSWPWFENTVTYANARLSHALILSGRWMGFQRALEIGLHTLEWLSEIQTAEQGHFRPIGSNGFYRRGHEPARYDQQPIEAQAHLSAAIEAYRTTGEEKWLAEARKAFAWYLGSNDLGLPLYDATTGGCFDGLHEDRVNQNQGAESTLAWLLSLCEMKLLENALASFKDPRSAGAPAETSSAGARGDL